MKKIYFILIVLIGLYLRAGLSTREVWYDEAFTSKMIKNSYSDIIRLSVNDVHPPLYYLVTKPFKDIRLPSIIFGLGSIVVGYALGEYLFKKGLLAGALVAVNPFLIAYSNEARSYSMLAFLFLLVAHFFAKAWKEDKYLGLAISASLLFLTHYVGLVAVLPFIVLILKRRKNPVWYFILVYIVFAVVFCLAVKPRSMEGLKWIPEPSIQSIRHFALGYENADTSGLYADRYFIGFIAIILVTLVLIPRPIIYAYMGICIYIVLMYQPISYGYKDLATYLDSLDRQAVFTNATEFISTNYYSDKVKLQEGNWAGWVVVKDTDIVSKSESYYLVNKGAIENWSCEHKFNNFCIYSWERN